MNKEQLEKDFGTVEVEGKTYWLTQMAYMNNYGTDGAVRYYANAIDEDENEYKVAWDTTQTWDDMNKMYLLEMNEADDNLSEEDTEQLEELRRKYEGYDALGYVEDETNACEWDEPVEVEEI